MAYKKYISTTHGIPPAPLIGERQTQIDIDFMKIKYSLRNELPMLTPEQILEQNRNEHPNEMILGQLMLMGFQKAANEICKLIRKDYEDRELSKRLDLCPRKELPLVEDDFILSALAKVLSQCEIVERQKLWSQSMAMRLYFAEKCYEDGYIWLAKGLVESCVLISISKSKELNDAEGLAFMAESHLTLAFLLYENFSEDNESEVMLRLRACLDLTTQNSKCIQILRYQSGNTLIVRNGMIKIKLQLLLGRHGWVNYSPEVEVLEILDSKTLTLYQTACIISCQIILNNAKRNDTLHVRIDTGKEGRKSSDGANTVVENAYLEAIRLAFEGQNDKNLCIAMYEFGAYLIQGKQWMKAKEILLQLERRAFAIADLCVLGVTSNTMGFICTRNQQTMQAINHLYDEWEMGFRNSLPVLQIESMRDLGMILLQEGKLEQAEALCYESYYILRQLRMKMQENSSSKVFLEIGNDEMYDHAWAMSGITMGQSFWGRFSGHGRSNKIGDILAWKTIRKPLPPVKFSKSSLTYETVSQNTKHMDLERFQKKYSTLEQIKEFNQVNPLTPDEYLAEWASAIEDDKYEFQHDLWAEDYRARVIAKNRRINASMSVAFNQQNNALKASLTRKTAFDVRSIHLAWKAAKKLSDSYKERRKASVVEYLALNRESKRGSEFDSDSKPEEIKESTDSSFFISSFDNPETIIDKKKVIDTTGGENRYSHDFDKNKNKRQSLKNPVGEF